jgi:hypothetical protein
VPTPCPRSAAQVKCRRRSPRSAHTHRSRCGVCSSTVCRRFESCRGHYHSPDKTSLDQYKHRSWRILCSVAVCRDQAPSVAVRETIAKRRTALGAPVDRLLRPRRAACALVVPNPDPRSDRLSRQTDCGGPRALPCRCRLVWRCVEGRGAFPPLDHRCSCALGGIPSSWCSPTARLPRGQLST